MFEPFFTTKAVGKGTGLGLSQIFGFARQSGGDVAIASALGQGTTVSLYLPRSAAAAEQARSRAAPADPLRRAGARGGHGAAILVVEDDPRVSRSTVAALEELGYRPHPCASGREALDILARDPDIALVVTDVMMPEMTGTELAAEVRRLYPGDAHPVRHRLCRRGGRGRRPRRPRAAAQAVHRQRPRRRGRRRFGRAAQRIAPRLNRRGSSVSAPRIGQRRCHGLTSIRVPAWRLIFQAR